MWLYISGYFECIDLHLQICDQKHMVLVMEEVGLLFLVIYVGRVHYVAVFCCQDLELEVHYEGVL